MDHLIEAINNKEIINEDIVLELVLQYIEQNNLDDYLNDFRYHYKSCDYIICDKLITFNEDITLDLANKLYNYLNNNYGIDEEYKSYVINFFYLFQVYHELTHPFQHKRDDGGYKRSYSYLDKLSHDLMRKNIDYYKTDEGHNLFPTEIEADNIGFSTSYKILKKTNIPKRELKILYGYFLGIMLYDYQVVFNEKRIISPIEKLSNSIDNINMNKLMEITEEDKLNFLERIKFGLPITFDEYKYLFTKRLDAFEKVKTLT